MTIRNMDMEPNEREPTSVMLEFDDLPQHTMNLDNIGDISFGKRTIQRNRCSFRVFVNTYWNVPSGFYKSSTNKKCYLRTPKDVRKFMRDNDYYDPILNPAGTKGSP